MDVDESIEKATTPTDETTPACLHTRPSLSVVISKEIGGKSE